MQLQLININFFFSAASIHTTKGFGGYRTSTCMPNSHFRFLGPSVKIAIPLTILWATACSFLAILILQSTKVLSCYQHNVCINEIDPYEDESDLFILASLELLLAVITFLAVFLLLRIDCKYDPDWSAPPPDPQGTAIGGVSVIGGVGTFSMPTTTTTASDRVGRIAWVV